MNATRNANPQGRAQPRLRSYRVIAILAVLGVFATGSLVATDTTSAVAAEKYPSWSDVVKARKSEANTRAKVVQIRALIVRLEAQVKKTEADSVKKGNAYQEAEEKYFEASIKAAQLKTQADRAAKTANNSESRAGQLAAQLARTGGNDLTLNLLFDGKNADDLLASMGQARNVTAQTQGIYSKAVQDRNSAQSLTDQADVAKDIRADLKKKSQKAFEVAQKAAESASNAYDDRKAHKAVLEGQLRALTTDRKLTEKKYAKGVKAQYGAGASLAGGQISSSGWARPASGYITSGFGYRLHPVYGTYRLHSGTDIAGAGCGAPIYAAHSGTVIYSGWYGTYGNFILIQNTDSVQTGYAHIVNGGLLVKVGQKVGVGQHIANEGTTGASTGCHLHFEVRVNGVAINSVPFMRDEGIQIG